MTGDSSPVGDNGHLADDEVHAYEDLRGQVEDINHRLDALEARVDQGVQAMREHLRDRIDELQGRIDELEARCQRHQETLDDLVGLAEGQQSTPEKRLMDVRQLMINQARARDDDPGSPAGTVAWTYSDVIDHLESNGHGQIDPKQAYRLMEKLAETDGFAEAENQAGQRTVRTSLSALTANGVVDNVNNEDVEERGRDGGTSTSTM